MNTPTLWEQQLPQDRLFAWGKQHGFPEWQFSMSSGDLGDHRSGIILSGEERWRDVYQCTDSSWLQKAVEGIECEVQ